MATTDEGSFVVALTMDVGWLTDMLDAVDAHKQRGDAANQVMDLIIKGTTIIGGGTIGLIAAVKALKGKPPDKVKLKSDGTAEITTNRNNFLVDERTLKLMQDSPTREAIADLGKNASQVDGLKYLRIGADTEAIKAVRLTKTDLTSFKKPPEADELGTETTRREAG